MKKIIEHISSKHRFPQKPTPLSVPLSDNRQSDFFFLQNSLLRKKNVPPLSIKKIFQQSFYDIFHYYASSILTLCLAIPLIQLYVPFAYGQFLNLYQGATFVLLLYLLRPLYLVIVIHRAFVLFHPAPSLSRVKRLKKFFQQQYKRIVLLCCPFIFIPLMYLFFLWNIEEIFRITTLTPLAPITWLTLYQDPSFHPVLLCFGAIFVLNYGVIACSTLVVFPLILHHPQMTFYEAFAINFYTWKKKFIPYLIWDFLLFFLFTLLGYITVGLAYLFILPWIGHVVWNIYEASYPKIVPSRHPII